MMQKIGVGILVVAIAVGAVGLTVYKFQDCRSVGHSVLYCVLDLN